MERVRLVKEPAVFGRPYRLLNKAETTIKVAYFVASVLSFTRPAVAMDFHVAETDGTCSACKWIAGHGDIEDSDPEALSALLKGEDGGLTLVLDSLGGSLSGGISLGERIRELGLSTEVGRTVDTSGSHSQIVAAECSSACAFAFLGGANRYVRDGSKIGVHQFYRQSAMDDPQAKLFSALDVSSDQKLNGVLLDYVYRMGVDTRLLARASMTSPESMYFLTAEELIDYQVEWDPKSFLPWQIEPSGRGVLAISYSQDHKTYQGVYCTKAGGRSAIFREAKNGDIPDSLKQVSSLRVLGRELPLSMLDISADGEYLTIRSPIPVKPNFKGDVFMGSGDQTRDEYDWAAMLNPEGLVPAVRLALKNCVG